MSTGPDRGQRLAPGATVPPLATERPKPPPPDHGTPTCWCGSYERGVAEGRRQAAENLFETLRAAGVYAVHTTDGRVYQLADVAFAVPTAEGSTE